MYYRTKQAALNNGHRQCVGAILRRNRKVVCYGFNQNKTHPMAYREFPNGETIATLHAEMAVLRQAMPGDTIEVMRWRRKDHRLTMARPCVKCRQLMRQRGIKSVRYTDWNGAWKTEVLNESVSSR